MVEFVSYWYYDCSLFNWDLNIFLQDLEVVNSINNLNQILISGRSITVITIYAHIDQLLSLSYEDSSYKFTT